MSRRTAIQTATGAGAALAISGMLAARSTTKEQRKKSAASETKALAKRVLELLPGLKEARRVVDSVLERAITDSDWRPSVSAIQKRNPSLSIDQAVLKSQQLTARLTARSGLDRAWRTDKINGERLQRALADLWDARPQTPADSRQKIKTTLVVIEAGYPYVPGGWDLQHVLLSAIDRDLERLT